MSIIEKIFEYPFLVRIFDKLLTDKEKIILISINKYFNNIKIKFTFRKRKRIIKKDKNKWFYNCLTKITINENFEYFEFPTQIKKLNVEFNSNQNIQNCIPNSVTHLVFGFDFNQTVKNSIPNSVTHLIFVCNFDKNLECLPSSITHLSIKYYNEKINKLPSSLRKLKCTIGFFNTNRNIISPTTTKVILNY